MKVRLVLPSLFIYSIWCSSVLGTTTIEVLSKPASHSPPVKVAMSCTVIAKFAGESYETEDFIFRGKSASKNHVSWNFDIESNEGSVCPEGSSFKLSIRSGDVVKRSNGSEFYVYPVHISPLQKGKTYTLFLRKQLVKDSKTQREYTEWLPSDVDNSIQEK